jgi:phage tail-like protein
MSVPGPVRERYADLRDGDAWSSVVLDGVEVLRDGSIELRRLPRVSPALTQAAGPTDPTGIAFDRSCGLYLTDAATRRIIRVALDCGERRVVDLATGPGGPGSGPKGLSIGAFGWVLVADDSVGGLLVLSPDLAIRDVWTSGLVRPIAVAADDDRVVYVLDAVAGLVRLDPFGAPIGIVAGAPASARAIAVGPDGTLYVANGTGAGVLRFDRSGTVTGAALAPGSVPQALAVSSDELYVADETTGTILVISLADDTVVGSVEGYRGPVSALAVDQAGSLYIKPGPDETYVLAQPRAAHTRTGQLTTAVLDAGEENSWVRAVVDASVPAAASAFLEIAGDPPGRPPNWTQVPTLDTPLPPSRYLALRLNIERGADGSSPRIHQVRAETAGDSYYDYLPAVYSKEASRTPTLDGLLGLTKAEIGDLEAAIQALPRRFTGSTAGVDDLRWLAGWLALPLPPVAPDDDERSTLADLIAEVPDLYARRGTLGGLRRVVEIYAGVVPSIFEDFRTRRIWVLGEVSDLGFDTMLPSTAVDGLIVDEGRLGAAGPESAKTWGSALFAPSAHRFQVVVPAGRVPTDEARIRLAKTIDDEKPAHTEVHVCYPEPRLRVGVQARLGLDAIVAGGAPDLRLDQRSRLDLDAALAADVEDAAGSVGRRGRLAVNTRLG